MDQEFGSVEELLDLISSEAKSLQDSEKSKSFTLDFLLEIFFKMEKSKVALEKEMAYEAGAAKEREDELRKCLEEVRQWRERQKQAYEEAMEKLNEKNTEERLKIAELTWEKDALIATTKEQVQKLQVKKYCIERKDATIEDLQKKKVEMEQTQEQLERQLEKAQEHAQTVIRDSGALYEKLENLVPSIDRLIREANERRAEFAEVKVKAKEMKRKMAEMKARKEELERENRELRALEEERRLQRNRRWWRWFRG